MAAEGTAGLKEIPGPDGPSRGLVKDVPMKKLAFYAIVASLLLGSSQAWAPPAGDYGGGPRSGGGWNESGGNNNGGGSGYQPNRRVVPGTTRRGTNPIGARDSQQARQNSADFARDPHRD